MINGFEVQTEFSNDDELINALISQKDLSSIAQTKDAEKALVRALNPEYNDVKFSTYPGKGESLKSHGYDRVSYFIREDIQLYTAKYHLSGNVGDLPNNADVIAVNNLENEVTIIPCPNKVNDV